MLFGKKPARSAQPVEAPAPEPKSKPAVTDDRRPGPADDSLFADSVMGGGEPAPLGHGLDEVTIQQPSAGRPKVMSVTIKDRKTLHAAYMPFLGSGGIFVPSSGTYTMGDEVFLLLKLVDSPENVSIAGKVVWITPAGAMSNRVAGIGIQFTGSDAGKVKTKIEGILGGALKSRRMTHTM